jgi:hypothetical protein
MQLELPFKQLRARPEVIRGGIRLAYPKWVYEYERAKILRPRYTRDSRGRFY